MLTVDEDTPWASQIEIAAAIAVEFGAKLARFPAAALATTERVSPNLLTDARFVSSDVAKRAIAACETRHRGGWGAPVEVETPEAPDVLNVEDEKTGEGEAAGGLPPRRVKRMAGHRGSSRRPRLAARPRYSRSSSSATT